MAGGKHSREFSEPIVINGVHELQESIEALSQKDDSSQYGSAPFIVAEMAQRMVNQAEELAAEISLRPGVSDSAPMIAEGIRNLLGGYSDSVSVSKFRERCVAAVPSENEIIPHLIFHNLSGNLFLSGWESLLHGLLLGARNVVRCSDADRVFPCVLEREWETTTGAWSGGIVPYYWPHSCTDVTALAFELTDAAVLFGSDETNSQLATILSAPKPVRVHGSRISFEILDESALEMDRMEAIARAVAYDFSVYEQQGCLSPRALFVPSHESLDRFLTAVAGEMQTLALRLPGGVMALADKAQLTRARDETIMEKISGGQGASLVSRPEDPFLITVRGIKNYVLGPTGRYVDIRLYDRPDDVVTALAPYLNQIGTLGFGGIRENWSDIFHQLAADRVVEPGKMQKPEPGWIHDGLLPFEGLIR